MPDWIEEILILVSKLKKVTLVDLWSEIKKSFPHFLGWMTSVKTAILASCTTFQKNLSRAMTTSMFRSVIIILLNGGCAYNLLFYLIWGCSSFPTIMLQTPQALSPCCTFSEWFQSDTIVSPGELELGCKDCGVEPLEGGNAVSVHVSSWNKAV